MTILITNQRERTRFYKFAFVGFVGAIVDFGIANLLVLVFHASLVVAGIISFVSAILNNFIWNRYWIYPESRTKHIRQQFVQFAGVSVMGLVIRIPILRFVEPPVNKLLTLISGFLPFAQVDILAKNITLAIAVVIVMFWNFFANRYWTYSDVES